MGTSYVGRRFDKCAEETLRREVRDAYDESRNLDGVGDYNGKWGGLTDSSLIITDLTFRCDKEAAEWLSDNCEKRYGMTAVKVFFHGKQATLSIDKKIANASRKLVDQSLKITAFDKSVIERVRNGKSSFRACTDCKSKISTEHIYTTYCPVCKKDSYLYTKTDVTKIEAMQSRRKTLEKQIDELRQQRNEASDRALKTKQNKEWYWLVGANCAC